MFDGFASHGSHFLSAILLHTDGHAVAPCPVCMADAQVPTSATWHEVRCGSCGTEYIATDGSGPPAAPLPAPVAVLTGPACAVCGTRPPVGGWTTPHCTACGITFEHAPAFVPPPPALVAPGAHSSSPDETPVTIIYGTGVNARAACPRCGEPAVVPRGAKGWVWFACASCKSRFKADSGASALPRSAMPARAALIPARPGPHPRRDTGPDSTPVSEIYTHGGKTVSPCPKCGTHADVPPGAKGWVWFACTSCRKRFKADMDVRLGWAPPPPTPLSVWGRIRKWFTGG